MAINVLYSYVISINILWVTRSRLLKKALDVGPLPVDHLGQAQGPPNDGGCRRGSRGWALGRAPTPGAEFYHSKCNIQ